MTVTLCVTCVGVSQRLGFLGNLEVVQQGPIQIGPHSLLTST